MVPGVSGISEEDPQKWLAWLMGMQSLNEQPRSLHEIEVGPLQLSRLVYLWDSWQWEQGLSLVFLLALGNLFFMLDCHEQPEYRGEVLGLKTT